ncbi:MAG: glycosyl hydrolase family 65 protein [Methylococcales bacterium]
MGTDLDQGPGGNTGPGAAGWLYRASLERILGLRVYADQLYFDPCIPRGWRGYTMRYRHENTGYRITVENPAGVSHGVTKLELDGIPQTTANTIPLLDDGKVHRVRVSRRGNRALTGWTSEHEGLCAS